MAALDEDLLDEIGDALATLPEPLASAVATIEVARAEGDATGVRKHCFELGVGVVRYATSVALAMLAHALGEQRAPVGLARTLGRAARLTDGEWCGLLRQLYAELNARDISGAKQLAFATGPALSALVSARNGFIHDGASGDDAPDHLLTLLGEARPLLTLPLCMVLIADAADTAETSEGAAASEADAAEATAAAVMVQRRVGQPLRAGAWRKWRGDKPAGLAAGAQLVLADTWLPLSPWLPAQAERLLLLAAPPCCRKVMAYVRPRNGRAPAQSHPARCGASLGRR